jgi:peptide/nickel transport system substrate-binding protein
MKSKLLGMLALVAVLAALAACAAPTPERVVETVEVVREKEVKVVETVEVVKEVVKEVVITPTPEAPKPKGTLRVALTTFPNSIDLATTAERNAENAAWQLYNSLVWVNDEGKIVPALAESWEVSEDGTEYIFHLRRDVVFHNGEPFTADSVVFSWERGSRPEMQWSDRWQRAKSVEKIDDYTVKVVTEAPDPLLLRVMAQQWAMVPPKYIAEVGEEGFTQHPIGTGPFMFVEWVKGDRIVYKANPNYWEKGLPKVETLIFRPIPESATRVAAIQTDEVDIVTRLSAEEAQSLLGLPHVKVIRYPVDRIYYVAFNNLTTGVGTPVEDVRVRQAMNYAVDRQAIIDSLFGGYARLATGLIHSSNLGYDKSIEPYPYDPDKARELLAEAGYPDGFEIDMACPTGAYTHFEEVCEAIVGYLGEVGIKVNLEFMESGKYWDLEAEKKLPPLFGDSWSERSGEALPRLIGALGGWDASFSAWSDPKIDELLEKIGRTVDEEQRAALYSELHRYMYENPPFIYLYEPVTFEAINVRVQDYKPRAAEDYFLKAVWVLEE